ncbi:MAG: pantoate--beta-alanine ligase [bacterium]|nr:pantoate--beta-alanine ligase [bacterium]
MQIIESIAEMKLWSKKFRKEGKTIGLVPTMGFFHDGHLNLMREAKKQCDKVVISIYVNPTQFGPKEDFSQYPRDLEHDLARAEEVGVDAVFVPSDKQMYPAGYKTYVKVESSSDKLCGRSRPGHFRGVVTIVTKLLNIVQPDILYLGQKDAQQAMLLSKMVKDLNMNSDVVMVPTTREPDGLAMSSRNKYLSPDERNQATVLYQSLQQAKNMIDTGERNSKKIITAMRELISQQPSVKIDYIAIVNPETLEGVQTIGNNVLIALAVYIGKTRLIDNIIV